MPFPQTSTVSAAGDESCASVKLLKIRGFSDGCLYARVSSGKTLVLSAINIGASVISVDRVIEGDCDALYYVPMVTPENCLLAVSAKTPIQPLNVEGYYRFCISPANPDALLGEEHIDSGGTICCALKTHCQP
jgi:hypothetical protein